MVRRLQTLGLRVAGRILVTIDIEVPSEPDPTPVAGTELFDADDLDEATASPELFLWTVFTRFEPAGDLHAKGAHTERYHTAQIATFAETPSTLAAYAVAIAWLPADRAVTPRARAAASPVASSTASTSLPSTTKPGMP